MINEIKQILNVLEQYKNSNNKEQIGDLKEDFKELLILKKEISEYCTGLQNLENNENTEKKLELFCKLHSATLDLETFFVDLHDTVVKILKEI